MTTLTMRRHGFADWIELSTTGLHVDYLHMRGSIEIVTITPEHVILRNAWGEIKHEYDHDVCTTVYRGTVTRSENPLDAADEIEKLIRAHTGLDVTVNRAYVEAYMITNRRSLYAYTALDVPIYNGVDVRGLTVGDMLRRGMLDWSNYADGSYRRHMKCIVDLLDTSGVHDMSFVDFYTMVHDNCSKPDFRERVENAINVAYVEV